MIAEAWIEVGQKPEQEPPHKWWPARPWFKDQAVFIIGPGPSLTQADCDLVRELKSISTIVVGTAWKAAPWADFLYHADAKWWGWYMDEINANFMGMKLSAEHSADKRFPVFKSRLLRLAMGKKEGFQPDYSKGMSTGGNSGYQAAHMAGNMSASEIYLLGFDMKVWGGGPSHHDGWNPDENGGKHGLNPGRYDNYAPRFATLCAGMAREGISLVNCSRRTAITGVPRRPLEEVIEDLRTRPSA